MDGKLYSNVLASAEGGISEKGLKRKDTRGVITGCSSISCLSVNKMQKSMGGDFKKPGDKERFLPRWT